MTEYNGQDETTLRKLLENCTEFQERRKLRAALRDVKSQGVANQPTTGRGNVFKSNRCKDVRESDASKAKLSLGIKEYGNRRKSLDISKDLQRKKYGSESSKDIMRQKLLSNASQYNTTSQVSSVQLSNVGINKYNDMQVSFYGDHAAGVKSDTTSLQTTRFISTTGRRGSTDNKSILKHGNELKSSVIDRRNIPPLSPHKASKYATSVNDFHNSSNHKTPMSRLGNKSNGQAKTPDMSRLISDPIEIPSQAKRTSRDIKAVSHISDSNVKSVSDSNVKSVSDSNVKSVSDSNVKSVSDSNVKSVSDSNVKSVSNVRERYEKPVLHLGQIIKDNTTNTPVVVSPFQRSFSARNIHKHQSLDDRKKAYLDKAAANSIKGNTPQSPFCRNDEHRRSLPITDKITSLPSFEKKELKSNIRTSLPLVQLGGSNYEYKPRPVRRVSFEGDTKSTTISDPIPSSPESTDIHHLLITGIPSYEEGNKFSNTDSEKELQLLLSQTSDLGDRKKIRKRIKEIRETEIIASQKILSPSSNEKITPPTFSKIINVPGTVDETTPSILSENTTPSILSEITTLLISSEKSTPSISSEKTTLSKSEVQVDVDNKILDYDKIQDEELLRQLLNETVDYSEKGKIRGTIRQLRRRSELEKVSAGTSSVRRSSSLNVPRKHHATDNIKSVASSRRCPSPQINIVENVNGTQYSTQFDKSDASTSPGKINANQFSELSNKEIDSDKNLQTKDSVFGHSSRKSIDEDFVKQVKGNLHTWNKRETKYSSQIKDSEPVNKPQITRDKSELVRPATNSVSNRAAQHKEKFSLLKQQLRESLSQCTESLTEPTNNCEQSDNNTSSSSALRTETPVSEDVFKNDLLEKSQRDSVTSSPNKISDVSVAVRKRSRIEMERAFSDIINDLDITDGHTSDPELSDNDEKTVESFVTSGSIQLMNTENTNLSNNMDVANGNRVLSTLKPILFTGSTTKMQCLNEKDDVEDINEKIKNEENNNMEISELGLETIQEDKDVIIQKSTTGLKLQMDKVNGEDDNLDGSDETGLISPLVSDLQPKAFLNKRNLIRSKSLNLRPTSPTNYAIDVQTDEDGTIKVQQTSQSHNRNRIVTITTKKYRTPNESDAEERNTVVETKFSSPGGSMVTERDEINTKKRVTSRGSNYFERSAMVTKKVKDSKGGEIIQHQVTDEKSNMSVSSGLSWGDRSTSRKIVSKPAIETVPMIVDDASVSSTMKSHATLILNKLNVSKASSGYGSVSGSEEEDKEEMTDRPPGCPSVITPLKDFQTLEGTDVTLECCLTGTPTPDIIWYQDNQPITDSSSISISFDEISGKAALTITDVSSDCNGVFRCYLKNELGEAETMCNLSVKKQTKHAPIFSEGLHDTKVAEGHSVTLACHVSEAESVSWLRDGVVQKSSSDFKQTFDGGLAKLEIGEVFLDDIAKYSCVAKNDLGEEVTSCKLRVTACSSETNVVPMFLTKLTNQNVKEGCCMVFECDVIGTPEPKVMWTRNGSTLPDYSNHYETYDGRLARLEIPVITIKDAGHYEIVAENSCGRVSMDSVLTVKACHSPPSITQPLSNKTARSGDRVKLQCGIFGTPKPTISWRKNGMVIGQTMDFVQTYNSNNVAALEISGVCEQDSGSYECVAVNPGGNISCTCQLIIESSSNCKPTQFSPLPSPYSHTVIKEPLPTTTFPPKPIKPPSVSQLRMQFQVGGDQSNVPKSSSIRRWHSLPPQENRFSAYKGENSSQPQFTVRNNTSAFTMSSFDHITNEEELQKLMNDTDSFDEKKKIRARIRTLHEEQRKDYETKRLEREKDTETAVRKQYEIADQEKARKMEAYAKAPATGGSERESQYSKSSQSRIAEQKKAADDDKQKKLESYSKIAESKTGGTTTTTTQKTTLSKTTTPMGMSYSKKPAGGAKSAMSAFKQMDNSANPAGAKGGANSGGGLKPNISRSPSSIKQVLLDWSKAMTREYIETIEVTNFSSSWNNGMAFCALIHHFYPDSFDFTKLDPKQRRANFNLAFNKAEELADIAPLLDVEDMVKMKNPDWKCVFTYVQSFYRKLRDHERNKAAPARLPTTVEQ